MPIKKRLDESEGDVKINDGRNLANTSRGQGTFGLTNKDKLKAGKAAAKALMTGAAINAKKARDEHEKGTKRSK